ncbi:hypothetical protein OAI68_06575 [Flavobacteriaceae bacterium]|nr:hypothetical protein [Flavobacteriaceae bacterium]MDC0104064.1 hypothetical protein [Flavobacteriaceae bacterium]MDC3215587.1 hypothetical protein [Flavobacteriaceae bacterium]
MKMTIILIIGLYFSAEDWIPYFENKEIEISFKTSLCEDHQNGVSLEYYLIRVKNKTDETLVVNFYLGDLDDKSEENKVAFVLNPLEIKTGSCDYQPVKLRLFRSESSKKGKGNTTLFNLNTITTVEVY